LRQNFSRSNQPQDLAQPQVIVFALHSGRTTPKATPSVQQVWVPKGSRPTKTQSQAPNPLHSTVASWPFSMWGTDIVGPIDPPTSRDHRFILAATDYFTKWAEAIPLKEFKASYVVKFFKMHVLYRFGTPQRIISDNGMAFKSSKVYALAEQFNIDWRFSSIYNPRANGLAEAFNKTLINIMKKTVDSNQRDWDNRLHEALWAYRTTYRTPRQATPYSLAFGVEVVLPLEVELPSLRVAMQNDITMDECQQLRMDKLDAMDEKRLIAQ
jgi:Integrase core domain